MVLGDQGRKAIPLDEAWWSYELLADMLVLKIVGISFDHPCQITAKLRFAPTPSISLVVLAKQAPNPIAPTQDLVLPQKEIKKEGRSQSPISGSCSRLEPYCVDMEAIVQQLQPRSKH